MRVTDILFGDEITQKAAMDHELLLNAVRRQIFCQASGMVLDISTAVLVQAYKGNDLVSIRVVTGNEYDKVAMDVRQVEIDHPGVRVEVIDGRDYTKAGKLRAGVEKHRRAQAATATPEAE